MKSEIIQTSLFVTFLVIFIGVFSAVIIGSCNDDARREEMLQKTCSQMCTFGVKACTTTSDKKIVVANCIVGGGHVILMNEIDSGK